MQEPLANQQVQISRRYWQSNKLEFQHYQQARSAIHEQPLWLWLASPKSMLKFPKQILSVSSWVASAHAGCQGTRQFGHGPTLCLEASCHMTRYATVVLRWRELSTGSLSHMRCEASPAVQVL